MRNLTLSLIVIFLTLSLHESANSQEASKIHSWNPRHNNVKETSLKEQRPPNVDLVIAPINSSDQLPINGTSVDYFYKITNQGLDNTNVLNANPFINTAKSNGILAGFQSVAELGPQESIPFDFSLDMCGCNRILNLDVMTDASNIKPETDETNNLLHKKIWGEYSLSCPAQIISANMFDERHPDVENTSVVYENHQDQGSNIFAFNFMTQQSQQITSNIPPFFYPDEVFPSISENRIAWIEFSPAWETDIIFMHDLSTNQTIPVTLAPLFSEKSSLRIDGDWIVVASNLGGSNPQITAYNVASGDVQTINANPTSFNEELLSISGNLLVWSAFGDNELDVFTYDLATGALETINTYPGEWALMPAAFDKHYVAFASVDDNSQNFFKIIVYDVSNHQTVADWPVTNVELIRGDAGRVFWLDEENKIHAYNLADHSQKVIYSSSSDIGWFNVSDGKIVWDQMNSGDWDIHIGDLDLLLSDQPAPEPACVQAAFESRY